MFFYIYPFFTQVIHTKLGPNGSNIRKIHKTKSIISNLTQNITVLTMDSMMPIKEIGNENVFTLNYNTVE